MEIKKKQNLFYTLSKREVITDDANIWLKDKKLKVIITSLPDMEEINQDLENWINWIKSTCLNLTKSLDDDGVIFFYQTNRKYKGQIIDKKQLISSVFFDNDYKNIFDKIVLKRDVGKVDLFRPTFTNLFAFSKKVKSGKATPDVMHSGKMIYKNAMGFNAVNSCVEFLKGKKIESEICDPFCGQGSVLKISNDLGYDAIGVDILEEQTKKAKLL